MIDCGCDEILLPQGSDGVDGKNAFTVTTDSFPQPAVGSPAAITVSDTLQNTNQWAIPGQVIRITDASGNGGWYQVVSITGTTQISATNLGYAGSTTTGLTILSGASVSPAGLQGPQGDPGGTGATGDVGPANQLSIPPGNVTTLAPGSSATVTISGTAPNQTLAFGIPSGLPGANGSRVPIRTHYNQLVLVPGTSVGALIGSTGFTISDFFAKDGDWIEFELDTTVSRPSGSIADKGHTFAFDISFSDDNAVTFNNLKPAYTVATTNFNSLALSTCNLTCEATTPGGIFTSNVCTFSAKAKLYRANSVTMAYTVTYIGGDTGGSIITRTFKSVLGYNFSNTTGAYKVNIYNNNAPSLQAINTTITIGKYEMP